MIIRNALFLFVLLFMGTRESQSDDAISGLEERYLCVSDRSTGFAFNAASKRWETAIFSNEKKYLIAPSGFLTKTLYVNEVGSDFSVASCGNGFNSDGVLFCLGFIDFRFNRNNGRYISVYIHGYIGVDGLKEKTDEKADTPYLEIGRCSRF